MTLKTDYEDYSGKHRQLRDRVQQAQENISRLNQLLDQLEGLRDRAVNSWKGFVEDVVALNERIQKIYRTNKIDKDRLLDELRKEDQARLIELDRIKRELDAAVVRSTTPTRLTVKLRATARRLIELADALDARDAFDE
jgi:chromosome segregation ATPase